MIQRELTIDRPGGRIGVLDAGEGPLILAIPGMGEVAESYRLLQPDLVALGFRVAVMDLRGHGRSDASFASYTDADTAADALAVIAALGACDAVILGNSMGAAAGVIAAATAPEHVSALVLLGPFVRDHGGAAQRLLLRLALLRPWGRSAWQMFHRSLFPAGVPADHPEHVARLRVSLRRPDHWRAFQQTANGSHADAHRHLASVRQPTLVVMGDRDPDFKDPTGEAQWIATAVGGQVAMVEDSGHYPMVDQPDHTLAAIAEFLQRG